MSTAIFASRINGLPVTDAQGEELGRVRDIVVHNRANDRAPGVKGLVVQLFARRPIFVPMARIKNIDPLQISISGTVNTRRFILRDREKLIIDYWFDRQVSVMGRDTKSTIFDIAIEQVRPFTWEVTQVALAKGSRRFFSRTSVEIVAWNRVLDLTRPGESEADTVAAKLQELRPADVARELHDMSREKRIEVVEAMADEVLAEALEELPVVDQLAIISIITTERAADVLELMDYDDAADLIAEMPSEQAEEILSEMTPDEAEDVRTLLSYDAGTAGGLMNPEAVVLAYDATVADALALMRNEDLTPAMAALAFVCRAPLDTPTGRYLGGVHIQRLLREPPSALAVSVIDSTIPPLRPDASISQVARYFATYDLVCAPVVDDDLRLLGVVTVDDILDQILPTDWRGVQLDAGLQLAATSNRNRLSERGINRG